MNAEFQTPSPTKAVFNPESGEKLSDRQKTLFIIGHRSTCGNCNRGAEPYEHSHNSAPGEDGPGCGVTWEFVSSIDISERRIKLLRPDLIWRGPNSFGVMDQGNPDTQAEAGEAITQPKGALTVSSELGWRSHQEDRYVIEPLNLGDRKAQVLAVMDGHGGSRVAELIKDELTHVINSNLEGSQENIPAILQKTVAELNELTRDMDEGSTISIVIIPEDEPNAYVAVLGDSPVVISDADGKVVASPEHNAITNEAEREKAMSKGAIYLPSGYLVDPARGGGIQVSRSLGDKNYDRFLNRVPEVYAVKLGERSVIIVATDGVFDPAHKNTMDNVARLAAMAGEGASAEDLVADAMARGTRDNATAIVWRQTP